MHVKIDRFKSIRSLQLELGDLTILIGPPAGGKTNIMEALATLGYAVKATIETRLGEYPEPNHAPYYNELVRALSCEDLIWRHNPGKKRATISLGSASLDLTCSDDPSRLDLTLNLTEDRGVWRVFEVQVNLAPYGALSAATEIPPPRSITGANDLEKIINIFFYLSYVFSDEARERRKPFNVKSAPEEARVWAPAPRLYGFDRLGAIVYIMLGLTGRRYPYSYLDERAVNLSTILRTNKEILDEVNYILDHLSGLRVLPLADGRLAFIDAGQDVGASSISDTVLRILYGLAALQSNRPRKRGGVTLDPIVMLEEPEAHMYPVAYEHLASDIVDAVEAGSRVIVSTHSGRLAELLWEKVRSAAVVVYYVSRVPGKEGFPETVAYRVNMQEALLELDDLDSFLIQPPATIEELARKGILERPG